MTEAADAKAASRRAFRAGTATAFVAALASVWTMRGVVIMQVLLGIGLATAPSATALPGGAIPILLAGSIGIALWLISAALSRTAEIRARSYS